MIADAALHNGRGSEPRRPRTLVAGGGVFYDRGEAWTWARFANSVLVGGGYFFLFLLFLLLAPPGIR